MNAYMSEISNDFADVKEKVRSINADYSFSDVVSEVSIYSRVNMEYYFERLWRLIPDEYLYETYKDILTSTESSFYLRLFEDSLLAKIRHFNRHDTIDNPTLRDVLDKDGYLTIYHGNANKTMRHANSWTLDPKTAHFFGNRNSLFQHVEEYYVVTGKVKPDDVIAYITERNENEIVVLNKDVRSKKKNFFKRLAEGESYDG